MKLLRTLFFLFAGCNFALLSAPAQSPPFTFNWQDRRPIGMDVLAQTPFSTTNNPRGWFDHPNTDYISSSGMAQFRTDLLARADKEIYILTNMYAQGVIIWDVEGGEMSSISYVGDPRPLKLLAPEMDACADEFFAKFRAAGLRVGVTIRPNVCYFGTNFPSSPANGQVFIKTDSPYGQKEYACLTNGTWTQYSTNQQKVAEFYTNMLAKIEYAKTRWGATLFYLDSYGVRTDFGSNYFTYKDIALTNIMFAHPDILLMPEFTQPTYVQNTNWYAMSAPYQPVTGGWGYTVFPEALAIYPRACGVIRIQTQDSDILSISNSIQSGNIILVNSWYTNTAADHVRQAYLGVKSTIQPPNNVHIVP
jgi:hypothetical protein